jgi:hydrogenase nickel incorporation protein HypA/HybF
MHELPVTESILNISLKYARDAQAEKITDLYLVMGQLSSLVDESVQFYWDIIAKDTLAEGAKLHFRRIPAELQCMVCFEKYQPTDNVLACPNCGSAGAKVIAGEEFYLEAIDVEGGKPPSASKGESK